MSNLYVRLKTGFYTHIKTIRLRAKIGDDAFWIPPRMWVYAAENKPDGDLSHCTSNELAFLLGCEKHATSIKEALTEAGFLDEDGKIHQWDEHNAYHSTYDKRARSAANIRWERERLEKEIEKGKRASTDEAYNKDATSIQESYACHWGMWTAHASQLKYPPTKLSLELQKSLCDAIGPERAIDAIRFSIQINANTIKEDKNARSKPDHKKGF